MSKYSLPDGRIELPDHLEEILPGFNPLVPFNGMMPCWRDGVLPGEHQSIAFKRFFSPEFAYELDNMYPGWEPILLQMFTTLLKHGENSDVKLLLVKEKFGCLRIQFTGSRDLGWVFDSATSESMHTCTECGEHGVLTEVFGESLPRCPKHQASRD